MLKKAGVSTIEDGKQLPFRNLITKVTDIAKGSGETADLAKKALKQIKYRNYAQLLGYLYSGLVLGIGIPKLNIAITNAVEKKNKKEQEQTNTTNISNEFIQNLTTNNSKTFGAFYNAM